MNTTDLHTKDGGEQVDPDFACDAFMQDLAIALFIVVISAVITAGVLAVCLSWLA